MSSTSVEETKGCSSQFLNQCTLDTDSAEGYYWVSFKKTDMSPNCGKTLIKIILDYLHSTCVHLLGCASTTLFAYDLHKLNTIIFIYL